MRPFVFPAHVLHARLSVVYGAAAGLLAGRGGGGGIAVLPLVGTFVLRAYDDVEPASVVFCLRFYDHFVFLSPPFIHLW